LKLARHRGRPEIFLSVQGEGKSAGRPSVFLRLSHCNLYCTFCDTDYTWNWRGTPFPHKRDADPAYEKFDPEAESVELTPAEVLAEITSHACDNLVITGGEPLLQQAELVTLLRELRAARAGVAVEVETNGTLVPEPALDALVDQYNVSPKLASSGVRASHRDRPEAAGFFARSPKASFKFVVSEPRDVAEVLEYSGRHALGPAQVFLMPEGSRSETLRERQRWLSGVCTEHGFRLGDRLHIHLYGDERGK
jgi:organic radical activating enzyme